MCCAMLHTIPKTFPAWSVMVEDLGVSPTALAHTLDVTPRTLQRWTADDQAPRCASLALFWVTRWGQSALDADLFNGSMLARAQVAALEREVQRLRYELARVVRAGDFGCANDYAPEALRLGRAEIIRPRFGGG